MGSRLEQAALRKSEGGRGSRRKALRTLVWKESLERRRRAREGDSTTSAVSKAERRFVFPPSPKLWGSLVACPENGFGGHFSLASFRTFGVSFHECVHFTTKGGGGALGAKFPDEPMQQHPSSPINAFFVVGLNSKMRTYLQNDRKK